MMQGYRRVAKAALLCNNIAVRQQHYRQPHLSVPRSCTTLASDDNPKASFDTFKSKAKVLAVENDWEGLYSHWLNSKSEEPTTDNEEKNLSFTTSLFNVNARKLKSSPSEMEKLREQISPVVTEALNRVLTPSSSSSSLSLLVPNLFEALWHLDRHQDIVFTFRSLEKQQELHEEFVMPLNARSNYLLALNELEQPHLVLSTIKTWISETLKEPLTAEEPLEEELSTSIDKHMLFQAAKAAQSVKDFKSAMEFLNFASNNLHFDADKTQSLVRLAVLSVNSSSSKDDLRQATELFIQSQTLESPGRRYWTLPFKQLVLALTMSKMYDQTSRVYEAYTIPSNEKLSLVTWQSICRSLANNEATFDSAKQIFKTHIRKSEASIGARSKTVAFNESKDAILLSHLLRNSKTVEDVREILESAKSKGITQFNYECQKSVIALIENDMELLSLFNESFSVFKKTSSSSSTPLQGSSYLPLVDKAVADKLRDCFLKDKELFIQEVGEEAAKCSSDDFRVVESLYQVAFRMAKDDFTTEVSLVNQLLGKYRNGRNFTNQSVVNTIFRIKTKNREYKGVLKFHRSIEQSEHSVKCSPTSVLSYLTCLNRQRQHRKVLEMMETYQATPDVAFTCLRKAAYREALAAAAELGKVESIRGILLFFEQNSWVIDPITDLKYAVLGAVNNSQLDEALEFHAMVLADRPNSNKKELWEVSIKYGFVFGRLCQALLQDGRYHDIIKMYDDSVNSGYKMLRGGNTWIAVVMAYANTGNLEKATEVYKIGKDTIGLEDKDSFLKTQLEELTKKSKDAE